MALYHFRVSTISRGKGGSAEAASAYRSGRVLVSDRTGERYDYRKKRKHGGITGGFILGWTGGAQRLWDAAERAETNKGKKGRDGNYRQEPTWRDNATVAREIQVSIPRELTDQQAQALVKRYAAWIVEIHGVALEAHIHRPGFRGDRNHNPHCHLLFSCRKVDPETGEFGKKTSEWDELGSKKIKNADGTTTIVPSRARETTRAAREKWAEMVNAALSDAGISERVDHRSYAERDIDQEPVSISQGAEQRARRTGNPTREHKRAKATRRRNRLKPGQGRASQPVKDFDWTLAEVADREVERENIRDRSTPTATPARAKVAAAKPVSQPTDTPETKAKRIRDIEKELTAAKWKADRSKERNASPLVEPVRRQPTTPTKKAKDRRR